MTVLTPARMAAAVFTAVVVAGCGASASTARSSSARAGANATSLPAKLGLTGERLHLVRSAVRRVIEAESNGAFSSATIVASRRQAANHAVSGATVNSNQPVYVVTLHGHFIDRGASYPFGHKPPTGETLVLVIDRRSLRTTDYGIGSAIGTHRLGRAYPLPLG
jgi:hypothetical protein